MRRASLLLQGLTLGFLFLAPLSAQTARETSEQFQARTKWWREAKLGMFITWGPYAVPADVMNLRGEKKTADWYMANKEMSVEEYAIFASQLTASKFNAQEWVRVAKETGMKYIVITTKFHDGFSMFDTRLSDFNITKASPFGRDPLKELAKECERQGIRLCFYYSIMDWHHPDYLPHHPWERKARPPEQANLDRYIEDFMKGQLRELLTNYGPIGVIWFDGAWEHDEGPLHSRSVNSMIRSIQPAVLINDRNVLPEDFATPEQSVTSSVLSDRRLWEACMTVNDTWGYGRNDTNWKSGDELIRMVSDVVGRGGNFLLNVGPTAEGEFPLPITERFARLGAWIKTNGESIYGTFRGPYRHVPFRGSLTTKGNTLYIHVFEWPKGKLALPGLSTKVLSARTLDGGQRLTVTTTPDWCRTRGTAVLISKPRKLDPAATVIRLALAGPPVVDEPRVLITPAKDGAFLLTAGEAELAGKSAQYEAIYHKDFIGPWSDISDYATWTCEVPRSGLYKAEITYAYPLEYEGSEFSIGPEGGAKIAGTVKSTGSWVVDMGKTESVGELELRGGVQHIELRFRSIPKGAALRLNQIRLTPIR